MKITIDLRLCFEHPPIPDRSCDWVVSLYDDPEFGSGWGATEVDAIRNFLNKYLDSDRFVEVLQEEKGK